MDSNKGGAPKRILVAGGGAPAWMTCAYLLKRYERTNTKITLVTQGEPPGSPRVASVLPSFGSFLQWIGATEAEFMRASSAVFKLATVYQGWRDAKHTHVQTWGEVGAPLQHLAFCKLYFKLLKSAKDSLPPYHQYSLAAHLARLDKFCHPVDELTSIFSSLRYAWHFDEQQFCRWLARRVHSKIDFYDSKIESVKLNDAGNIQSVWVDGQALPAELFFDCTVSQAMIRNPKTLQDSVQDLEKNPIDSSAHQGLCLSVIHENSSANLSCDIARLLPIGVETIQPSLRYSQLSVLTNTDDCHPRMIEAFQQQFKKAKVEVTRENNYYTKAHWVNNCIAIGPASVNIHSPMVSMLDLTWAALEPLSKLTPTGATNSAKRLRYNNVMRQKISRVIDSVGLLRLLADAERSIYSVAQNPVPLSGEMQQKLALYDWRGAWPAFEDGVISAHDQLTLLIGMHRFPEHLDAIALGANAPAAANHMAKIQMAITRALDDVKDHRQYLKSLLQMPEMGSTS